MSFVSFERTETLKPIPRKSQEQKVNKCTFFGFAVENPSLACWKWGDDTAPDGNRTGQIWQAVAGCGSFLKYFLSRIVKE